MPSPDDVNRQELSAADAAERQAILDILNKRRNNLKLTARELAALRRYETRREADQRAQHLANVPQETLINLLQSTRRTVLKWENANMPGVRMDGRSKYYNLYRVLPWLKERWLEYGKATEKTDEETRARVDALVARAGRRGAVCVRPEIALTSARFWSRCGLVRTTVINQIVIAGYHLGADRSRLRDWRRTWMQLGTGAGA